MNTVVFRTPDHTYIGDASEYGLGGIAIVHGVAWRLEISENLRGRAHVNFLEFIIQLVSIWIDYLDGRIQTHDCILAMGDSTTAIG